MAAYTLTQLKALVEPVARRHGAQKVSVFGSYARGQATEKSDVDLLVDSGLRGLSFFGLLESVCSALGCDVDLIDVTQVEKGSPVAREIDQSGVPIYERKG